MVREEKFQEYIEQMKVYKADAMFLNEKLHEPYPVYKWVLGKNVFETIFKITSGYINRSIFNATIMSYPIEIDETDDEGISLWRLIQ